MCDYHVLRLAASPSGKVAAVVECREHGVTLAIDGNIISTNDLLPQVQILSAFDTTFTNGPLSAFVLQGAAGEANARQAATLPPAIQAILTGIPMLLPDEPYGMPEMPSGDVDNDPDGDEQTDPEFGDSADDLADVFGDPLDREPYGA